MFNRLLPFSLLLCAVLACAESPKPRPSTAQRSPSSEPAPTASPTQAPEAPAVTISAVTLFAAYKANEVAADEAYKGKILRITGRVENIGKDIIDTMYVTLNAGGFMSVQCMFADEHKTELAHLTKGQSVTVVGLCNGKFGNVLIKDCYLEK